MADLKSSLDASRHETNEQIKARVASAKARADAAEQTVHGKADQAADRAHTQWQSFKADTSAKMQELQERIERKRDERDVKAAEMAPRRPAREPVTGWRCSSSKALRKEAPPMPRRVIVATVLAAGMTVALLGCTGGSATTATSSAPVAGPTQGSPKGAPARPARYPARPVTMADARHCPVTIGHPVPRTMPWRGLLFGSASAYSNGSLWVGALWPHGVIIFTPDNVDPDGRLGMKFGWYRLTSGYLTITGRRLDAHAPPATGQTFPGSYGLTGFNASGVIFPTEGCWQVTGRAGRAALTFVTFVIKGHCDLNAVPIRCVAGRAR